MPGNPLTASVSGMFIKGIGWGKNGKNASPRLHQIKDTIEIWTRKFRLNGVFIIKPSIYAAFRGRIFFLSAGL